MTPQGKPVKDSEVVMTEIVLPSHANAIGTIFGGQVVSWIDIAAAIAAGRHARKVVVTASIDAMTFLSGIKLGQIVHIRATVNRAFKTSMEVGVRVDAEDTLSGETVHTSSAYLTFVALNSHGKPVEIPPVIPQTPDEKRRYEQALARRKARIALAAELKRQ